MTPDEAELRRLAKAATPGPWTHDENGGGAYVLHHVARYASGDIDPARSGEVAIVWTGENERRSVASTSPSRPQHHANAAFIAAANPAAIIALLNRLETLEAALRDPDRVARVVRSAAEWTPEMRADLVRVMRERWPELFRGRILPEEPEGPDFPEPL